MNVIDGQAGIIIYSSLIFYSLTINNILNIIVLLILAGVSLSLVLGEDGIVGRAVITSKTQNIASAKDKLELDAANYGAEFYQAKYVSGDSSETSLRDYILERIVTGEDYTVDEKKVTTGEFQISIADGTNANGTVDQDGSIIWDKIDYGQIPTVDPTAGFGTVNSAYSAYFGKLTDYSATSGSNWRLFYADSNYAYLISDSIGNPILNSQSGFGGDMTSNDFALGRNLNPKYTTTGNWALKTDGDNININIKAVAGLLDTTKWTNYANPTKGAQWAIGAPTLEMFIASYNATHTTQLDSTVESATSTGYKVNKDGGNFDTYVTGLGNSADLDKAIYCPNSESWWLASPCDYSTNCVALVSSSISGQLCGYTLSSLDYDYYDIIIGVRPLVSVPVSNIGISGQNKTITISDNYFNN